ncbi:MAG TPA: sulfatase-like hydrolase/transferase [Chthoniobacter sp.]|jgi:arylsulfatase A-like enzyme
MRSLFPPAVFALVLCTIANFAPAVDTTNPANTAGNSAASSSRPNFLFVYMDDQRFDAFGVVQQEQGEKGRWPWIQTPNIDRLAREGARFRNAFVVNSLCSPSRASLLTGCYGYLNGVVNNHTAFPVDNITYATQLRAAGYYTGFIGKWHMGNQSGQRPGFDYSASFVGQGHYADCPFEINGVSTPTQGWVDDVSTDFAIKFLEQHKDQPFCLAVGFKSCHGPFTPAKRFADFYGDAQARTVPNLNIPAIYLNAPDYGTAKPTPPGLVKTNLDYMRCIHGADEDLGHILDTLDRLHLTDNTMVIFSSDNGYYLGEHRLGDKRSAYEESMRVPLLVRYPKAVKPGMLVDAEAVNIDLAPTMLDYAGVAIPGIMQGKSWRPLLEGQVKEWRRSFFYCYFYESNFKTPTMMAVRTGTDKLVKYPGHEEWTELFDVKADPYELKNLAKDPDYVALHEQLETTYDEEAKKIGFLVPPYADNEAKDVAALTRPKEVVLDYHFDQDTDAARAEDRSGHGNHGAVHNAPLVDGRDGHKARHFDGESSAISVARSASISPVTNQWTIEMTFQSEKPDGILLAHGGASIGYCLYLTGGKPAFTIHARAQALSTVTAPKALAAGWNTVTVRITPDSKLQLSVNGQPVATAPLKDFIQRVPNNGLEIGANLGSPVLPRTDLGRFVGLIESVKIGTE